MSLTSDMKDELARAVVTTPSEVAAEVSATLRFAGGLHLVGGRILVEAELDSPVAARRLRTYLQALYNAESSVVVVSGSSLRRGKRYVVRVVHKADELARLTGLVDSLHRPVRGLPPVLVASGTAEAAAIWRGAFLARGSLMEPGRSSSLGAPRRPSRRGRSGANAARLGAAQTDWLTLTTRTCAAPPARPSLRVPALNVPSKSSETTSPPTSSRPARCVCSTSRPPLRSSASTRIHLSPRMPSPVVSVAFSLSPIRSRTNAASRIRSPRLPSTCSKRTEVPFSCRFVSIQTRITPRADFQIGL